MTDADRRRDPRFLRRLDLFNRIMRPMLPGASPLAPESSESNLVYLTQLFPMEEIELVLKFIRYRIDYVQDLFQEEPSLYEQYVADYNRFGGDRPFLG